MRLLAALAILTALAGCMTKTLVVSIVVKDGGNSTQITVSDSQSKPMSAETDIGRAATVSIPLIP
jgi:outer membrane protein assembly factor BamE (lipoprotein component of BamABCDE complex)